MSILDFFSNKERSNRLIEPIKANKTKISDAISRADKLGKTPTDVDTLIREAFANAIARAKQTNGPVQFVFDNVRCLVYHNSSVDKGVEAFLVEKKKNLYFRVVAIAQP